MSAQGLFPEFSNTLIFWVERLYFALKQRGVEKVFFLSREGQPLMRLFDLYQDKAGRIFQTYYLKVSRRSTLLPSLNSLDGERFDVLFRQYRNISLGEFLYSLGLEDCAEPFAAELGVSDQIELRIGDFPASNIFQNLIDLPSFKHAFDSERSYQREAFVEYLSSTVSGNLPASLAVVDVGWKGSIQDNLHAILCKAGRPVVDEIQGFYIGLVAEGSRSSSNRKDGLLFSAVGGRSPGFHIFNENRALFEILCAADHGSVAKYRKIEVGGAEPVLDDFSEQSMLEMLVYPAQLSIEKRFVEILEGASSQRADVHTLQKVAKEHARIVFAPTQQELDWFSALYHVENFGVREKSYFLANKRLCGLLPRLKFLAGLAMARNRHSLGFWPWRTLYDTCGPSVAMTYATIRKLQR